MNNIGLIAWICIVVYPGVVLANHNGTRWELWHNVYEDYVCDTSDGYLWLADACTFPVRKALDYLLRYGDDAVDLYDEQGQTFNDIPLYQWNENDTLDTYLYDYEIIFPYSRDKLCTDYMELTRTCMSHYFSDCSSGLSSSVVDTYIDTYKAQYCQGDTLLSYIDDQRGVLENFLTGETSRAECTGLSELYDNVLNQSVCTQNIVVGVDHSGLVQENITDYTQSNPDSFLDVRSNYAREVLSAFRCIAVEMRDLGCSTTEAQSLVISVFSTIVLPGVDASLMEIASIFRRSEESGMLAIGEEADRGRTTVGIFGDSYLLASDRVDDSDRSMCSFSLQWIALLRNAYVSIDIYPTEETATDHGATFVSSVEVSLLDGAGATLLEYSTSGNTLANTYTVLDQSKTTVTSTLDGEQLAFLELDTDVIQMVNPLGDVAVTISRYGSQYAVFVRMYDSEFLRSYGTFVDGCSNELNAEDITGLSQSDLAARRRRRTVSDDCLSECSQLDDENFEYTCAVTCFMNGEDTDSAVGSSQMAQSAQQQADSADSSMVSDYTRSNAPAASRLSILVTIFSLLLTLSVYCTK